MPAPLEALTDNPLIVKHWRSRLRPAQFLPTAAVVLCFCVVILWTGIVLGGVATGVTLSMLVGMGTLILTFGGANQVTTAVGQAKESGILDFHRVSPLPPSTVALGFFLGAPIREYALFALTVPFALYCAAASALGIGAYLQVLAGQVLTSWVVHAMSLLVALVAKRPRAAGQAILVLIVIGFFGTGGIVGGVSSALGIYGATDEAGWFRFFGWPIPWLAFLAIYQGAGILFLLIAAARKMRAERAHAYSKPLALAFLGTIVVLTLGAFWSAPAGNSFVVPACIYFLTLCGIVLSVTVTPDHGEYLKGVRRALRSGRRRAPVLGDSASNQAAVYGLAGLVALGATVAWEAIVGMPAGGRMAYSQAVAVGAFVVAYFGFGFQYFLLRFGKRGPTYFALFLFLVWLLPLMTSLASAMTGSSPTSGLISAMAISPLAGIGLSVFEDLPGGVQADPVRFTAMVSAVGLAFGFHFLLTALQRRLDREIRVGEAKAPLLPADREPELVA